MNTSGPSPSTVASTLARSDPGGLLYGAIVTGAVLVATGGHDPTTGWVVSVWAFVLVIYWLAHVYVHATESLFHGDSRHLLRRTADAARAELPVLEGGIPAMVVFLLFEATDADTVTSARAALYFTVVLLAAVGYIGARHVGRTSAASWGEALGAGLLGVLMVVAKTLLH
jgi:hypothetical protein